MKKILFCLVTIFFNGQSLREIVHKHMLGSNGHSLREIVHKHMPGSNGQSQRDCT